MEERWDLHDERQGEEIFEFKSFISKNLEFNGFKKLRELLKFYKFLKIAYILLIIPQRKHNSFTEWTSS